MCVCCRSQSTQQHLKNVYSSLALCMLVAAAGSYVHVVTRFFQVTTLVHLFTNTAELSSPQHLAMLGPVVQTRAAQVIVAAAVMWPFSGLTAAKLHRPKSCYQPPRPPPQNDYHTAGSV